MKRVRNRRVVAGIITVICRHEGVVQETEILEVWKQLGCVASHDACVAVCPTKSVFGFLLADDDQKITYENDDGPVNEKWTCTKPSQCS